MEKPLITVFTPTYNRAHTLPRVFESLKNQTFRRFKWVVLDDGSTDDTEALVADYRKSGLFEIDYQYRENQHKFHTVFSGVKEVKTPYFVIWDSDDSFPDQSLEILYREILNLPGNQNFIAVMGLSADENGGVVGDPYPQSPLDDLILNMRYRYKIRGDKSGIFDSKKYLKVLKTFNPYEYKKGVYIPDSIFYNRYDALGYKTRFVNKIIRTYHFDTSDQQSISNTRAVGKNRYGLMIGYLSFVNEYGKRLMKFPKALIRNIIGYQSFAFAEGQHWKEIQNNLKGFKILSFFLLPLSYFYKRFEL